MDVKILVHASPTTLAKYRTEHLGVLCSPRRVYGEEMDPWPWAADNDAFAAWDEGRYLVMLDLIKDRNLDHCLFVTAPDVVGDAQATLKLFPEWIDRIYPLPIAFVAQDGLLPAQVPWGFIKALFIGGTTDWKMGGQAARLIREAKDRGKWVHLGRVNSYERVRYARWLGCDSIDGSQFSWFRDRWLPPFLSSLRQGMITEEEENVA